MLGYIISIYQIEGNIGQK